MIGTEKARLAAIFAAFAANCTARTESLSPLYNDFPQCYNNSGKPTDRSVKCAKKAPFPPKKGRHTAAVLRFGAPSFWGSLNPVGHIRQHRPAQRAGKGNKQMPKYSVKKPFTVLVAVILVVVLGFVSLTGMQTDLLPNMNLPYLLVITTYPGASPEQVESDVTQPLENSLSTLNGVKNVTSQSNENYSLVILEYQDDTDMDSAMIKASTAVNQLSDSLPDMASTPTLMEMSPDMMATQYVAVDYEGMDIYELSDYVEDTIVPQLERVDGVASVSTTGLVKKSVQITLDQDKIDEVNDKLLVKVSDRLAEAKKQLDENEAKIKDGLAELDSAQSQLDSGKAQLNTQKQSLTQQLRDAIDQLNEEIPKLEEQIAGLKTQLDTAQSKLNQLKVDPSSLPEVTLPIDDALFASCKEILAKYDPQYDANAMPANLEEAKSDLTKMAAMLASIERAQQAIETEAAALTGGQSVSDACAALDD